MFFVTPKYPDILYKYTNCNTICTYINRAIFKFIYWWGCWSFTDYILYSHSISTL